MCHPPVLPPALSQQHSSWPIFWKLGQKQKVSKFTGERMKEHKEIDPT